MRKKKLLLFLLLLAPATVCFCQKTTDTAALIKEFKKIMDFAAKPYVSYTTHTRLLSEPLLAPEDTATIEGTYYRNEGAVYYNNGEETSYLQDSLLITINYNRKTIWISKVDVSTKDKLGVLSASNQQLQELMRANYTVQKLPLNKKTARLHFESRKKGAYAAFISTNVSLDYLSKEQHPTNIEMDILMQQPANDALISQIKNEGINSNQLIQTIGGEQFIVRRQKLQTSFGVIDYSKEKASQIPLWKDVIDYNSETENYTGKGNLADYTVTKTF